jgi:hypothetical protein
MPPSARLARRKSSYLTFVLTRALFSVLSSPLRRRHSPPFSFCARRRIAQGRACPHLYTQPAPLHHPIRPHRCNLSSTSVCIPASFCPFALARLIRPRYVV